MSRAWTTQQLNLYVEEVMQTAQHFQVEASAVSDLFQSLYANISIENLVRPNNKVIMWLNSLVLCFIGCVVQL